MKVPQWYAVQVSDPPRWTSYNDDAHSCCFARTTKKEKVKKVALIAGEKEGHFYGKLSATNYLISTT